MSCPICAAESDTKYRPFCCKRCADIDLGRWISGTYALPSEEPAEADELFHEYSAPQTLN